MKYKIKFIAIVFLWLGLSSLTRAEPSLIELYSIRDVNALEALIERESPLADTPEKNKRLGIAWHNLAAEEESGAAEKAVAILKPLVKQLPKDYEILGYLGSSQTMVGRDSWNPLTKMSSVNKGIAKIDKAILKNKDNITNRLIRIHTSLALPGFLGREDKIKPDLDYLVGLIDRKDTSIEAQGEINFLMGQLLNNEDKKEEAKVYLEKSIQVDPRSQWAKNSKEIIND